MFRSVIFITVILLFATITVSLQMASNKTLKSSAVNMVRQAIPTQPTVLNEGFYYGSKTSSVSSYAKAPFNPTVCTWIGGTTGNWEVDANWSCGHVPLVNNDVEIFTGTVTLNSDADVHSVIIGNGAGLIVTAGRILNIRQQ